MTTIMAPTGDPIADLLQEVMEAANIKVEETPEDQVETECEGCSENSLKCPGCNTKGFCWEHIAQHMSLMHPFHPKYEAVQNMVVRHFMHRHHLTSFVTRTEDITLKRVMPNRMQSVWFEEAEYLGLQRSCLVTWSPPKVKKGEDRGIHDALFAAQVDRFMKVMNLRAYNWTGTENFTFFAAERTQMPYLPADITIEEQESASGMFYNPKNVDPGKSSKRNKVQTLSQGAFFVPEPSVFPDLRIPGQIQRLHVHDSKTAGDGSGMYRESSAIKLLMATETPIWGDIIGIQTVVLGADYAFKGLFPIVPDEIFPKVDVDLIVDQESMNHQVHSTRFTKGKIIPIRHRQNKRHFWCEPLVLGEVVNRFISSDEMASQAMVIADAQGRLDWRKALDEDQTIIQEMKESQLTTEFPNEPHLKRATQKRGENRLMTAYVASGMSPFASPAVTDLVAGQTANKWKSNRKKSTPMPGIMVSGEKVWLMDSYYTGKAYPRTGYAGLVLHFKKAKQIIGIRLSKKDLARYKDALDTVDCDDKLQLIFMQDDKGMPYVLVLRSPLSIDGGVCLKLTSEDARTLKDLGYHFYRKVGGHQFPGLHEIGENGEPVNPSVLNPRKFDVAPQWTTDESIAMVRMLELTQFRGIMGHACNLAANLDYAGIYDPAKHLFNTSDGVIDPSLNAASDPTPVIRPMEESLLEAIKQGIPMDPCIFERVRASIEALHLEKDGKNAKPLNIKMKCRPHHEVNKEAMNRAVSLLIDNLTRFQFMAHGPVDTLQKKFRIKLANILTQAFDERHNAWSTWSVKTAALRRIREMKKEDRDLESAILLEEAKEAEANTMTEAYEKAIKLTDYEPGSFIALWTQLTAGNTKRFEKTVKPITMSALNHLPIEEFEVHYGEGGSSIPTAIVRTTEAWEFEPKQGEYLVRETTLDKVKSYQLVDQNGEVVANLDKEAKFYLSLSLTPLGYMPKIKTSKKKEVWEQAPNLLLMAVNNPHVWLGPSETETPGEETSGAEASQGD